MKSTFTLAFLALFSGMAAAQTPSQSTPAANIPRTLTLDEAIKAAISRNYTVRQSDNAVRIDEIGVTAAKDNAWLPGASASGGWGYDYSLAQPQTITVYKDTTFGGVPLSVPAGTKALPSGSHSLNWRAELNYNLYHGGSDIAQIRKAEANAQGASETFTWTRQQTAYMVTSTYLNVLRNNELVFAADSTLAEAMSQFMLIQGKYQAGVVPIGQVYQQQAVVQSDSLGLIQAENNLENAKADVLFLLNVPPNEYQNYTFEATGIDTSMVAVVQATADINLSPARLDAAINARPDILAQVQNIQAAQYSIDVTRGALLPSLDASAGIGGSGADADLGKIQVANSLNVGLTLTIPIFDKMQNRLTIEQQEVEVQNARITLQQDVQQIRHDAAVYVNNLQAAIKAISANETALTAAVESQRLAAEQLRVGAGTEVNLVIAEAAVESARTNYVTAKYNLVLAQRQLAYTLGQWNY